MTAGSAAPIALTGATGFVGGHVLRMAGHEALPVRALARRPQPPRDHVDWQPGALDDAASLRALAEGARAVIHVAGVVNAPDAAGFEAGNVEGTAAVLRAARGAGVTRFIHVSSLAAREPALSAYGASKAASEQLVRDSGLDWTIVRPPAVYGPGDREMLALFRAAKWGVQLMPPPGRFSLIHAEDLARLLIELATEPVARAMVLEPDDGTVNGWTHADFAAALRTAVGRPSIAVALPPRLLRLGATLSSWAAPRGSAPRLSHDRVRYFCHPDWVATAHARPTPALWQPLIETPAGLAATARWYRNKGWL